jgi:hypothetical protein
MADYRTLVCDRCSREEALRPGPVNGWITTAVPKGSITETAPPPTGDFCSVKCLLDYFSEVLTQLSLHDAMDDAERGL